MKPVQRLYISADETELVNSMLVLELSACGRGFITALTDTDCTGKLVRIDVGYPDQLYRWFTGYVERSQPAENGAQRMFVRELVGIFDKAWPCSFRHPTLKTITDWLSEKSGLKIHTAAGTADTPIPHFTHAGTGYQLLSSLGRAFSIEDFIWYQTPGGDVYVGPASGGMFAGKPVSIPPVFSQAATGGDTLSFPVIPGVRPGVEMNGRRVTLVRLADDAMEVTAAAVLSKTPFRRQLEAAAPELAGKMHLPRVARVVAHTEPAGAGDVADPFRPRYAVDVQLLDENGDPEKDTPVFKGVPLPVAGAGTEAGVFGHPAIGSKVELAFADGRQDKPQVRQTLTEGHNLPDIKSGEQLQQQRAGVFQRVKQDGSWQRETDQSISEKSSSRNIEADNEQRTLVSRTTTVQANDSLMVIGTAKFAAGAIQMLATADAGIATGGAFLISAKKGISLSTPESVLIEAQRLTEKIKTICTMQAGEEIRLVAPTVWMGTEAINVAQLMLDSIDLVSQIAMMCASHGHAGPGVPPANAAEFTQAATSADELKSKYDPHIS